YSVRFRRRSVSVRPGFSFATDAASSYHLYITHFASEEPARHCRIFEALRAAGLGVNLHYMPVYLQPYYRTLGFAAGLCPEAERYYAGAVSIPLYPDMTDTDASTVIAAVRSAARM
uniref:DegT/DnrJ/EryC1/StrS family aminotransferase n=1 Tax=Tardiphaga sp. TaxID=1926292 RepID=UPI0025D3D819